MGLLSRFTKSGSRTPAKVGKKEVTEILSDYGMLEKMQDEAKRHMGDPFWEYRQLNTLPEEFKYGMNCLFDRWAEQHGREIVQKAYEELKKDRKAYSIRQELNTFDLPGIPILFGVKIGAAIDAWNRAVLAIERDRLHQRTKLRKIIIKKMPRLLGMDEPKFLYMMEGEDAYETAWRLAVISGGLATGALALARQGASKESEELKLYGEAIEQLVSSMAVAEREIDEKETEELMVAIQGLGNAVSRKDKKTSIDEFLLQLGKNFWNVVVGGMVSSDPMFLAIVNCWVNDEKLEKEMFPEIESWRKEILDLKNTSDELARRTYEEIWSKIRNRIIQDEVDFEEKFPKESNPTVRKLIPEKMVFTFLKLFGYGQGLRQSIESADSSVLKFVFNKLAEEVGDESKAEWYKGNRPAHAILNS